MLKLDLDKIKEGLVDELDKRVDNIKDEMFEMYKTLKTENLKYTNTSIDISKRKLDEAINEVNKLKDELVERLTKAEETLNKASKILELDGHDINVQSFIQLFNDNQKNKEWMKHNSSDLELLRNEYHKLSKKVKKDKNEGIFENLANKVQTMETEVGTVMKERHRPMFQGQNFYYQTENGYSFKITPDGIILETPNLNNKITLNEEGIHLIGDVFINNKKIE
jgi:hypothetical protein